MDKRRSNNLNVTNPVYMKRDIDDDDDDDNELNPFGGGGGGGSEGRVILARDPVSFFFSYVYNSEINLVRRFIAFGLGYLEVFGMSKSL